MGDGAAAAVPSRFRTICVFCGSNAGRRKVYADAALELGHELVSVHIHRCTQGAHAHHARHALEHCHHHRFFFFFVFLLGS